MYIGAGIGKNFLTNRENNVTNIYILSHCFFYFIYAIQKNLNRKKKEEMLGY
jgi:hypothetical protein